MCKQLVEMPRAGGCMLSTLPDVLRGEQCSAAVQKWLDETPVQRQSACWESGGCTHAPDCCLLTCINSRAF